MAAPPPAGYHPSRRWPAARRAAAPRLVRGRVRGRVRIRGRVRGRARARVRVRVRVKG